MGSINKTEIGLNLWRPEEKPKMEDFNNDNRAITQEFQQTKEWVINTFSKANLLINGDFSVWQRGTVFDSRQAVAAYTADRWMLMDKTTTNNTRIQPSDDVPTGESGKSISFMIREKYETEWMLYQYLEEPLIVGEQYTLSFWIKGPSGATFSMAVNDQQKTSNLLNGRWQFFQAVFTKSDDPRQRISPLRMPTEAGTYYVKNVKLEKGPVATPFVKRSAFEEKRLCQRYYIPIKREMKLWVTSGYKDYIWVSVPLQIPMRIAPILVPPPNGFLVSDMCRYNEVYDMVPGNTRVISDNAVEFFLHKVDHGYQVPYVLATQDGGALDAEIYNMTIN